MKNLVSRLINSPRLSIQPKPKESSSSSNKAARLRLQEEDTAEEEEAGRQQKPHRQYIMAAKQLLCFLCVMALNSKLLKLNQTKLNLLVSYNSSPPDRRMLVGLFPFNQDRERERDRNL